MTDFDLQRFLTIEAPDRVRSQIDFTDLPTIATADALHEAALFDGTAPAYYFIYDAARAKSFKSGARHLVIGRRAQVLMMRFSGALLTESYSREEGRLGAWPLLPRIAAAIVGWRGTGMLSRIDLVAERFVLRTPDTTRVIHEQTFEADVEVFTTPAAP